CGASSPEPRSRRSELSFPGGRVLQSRSAPIGPVRRAHGGAVYARTGRCQPVTAYIKANRCADVERPEILVPGGFHERRDARRHWRRGNVRREERLDRAIDHVTLIGV